MEPAVKVASLANLAIIVTKLAQLHALVLVMQQRLVTMMANAPNAPMVLQAASVKSFATRCVQHANSVAEKRLALMVALLAQPIKQPSWLDPNVSALKERHVTRKDSASAIIQWTPTRTHSLNSSQGSFVAEFAEMVLAKCLAIRSPHA
jgi:hypothetical protein